MGWCEESGQPIFYEEKDQENMLGGAGGVLRIEHPGGGGTEVHAGMGDTTDGDSLWPATGRGEGTQDEPSLGAARQDLALTASGGHRQ